MQAQILKRRLQQQQQGQAMVLLLLFSVVVLLAVILLYNTGQLTREKMELQNAADAAAYSDAVLAARELNFIAYTNRAMVANEVAIGQLTAFETWGQRYSVARSTASAYPPIPLPFPPGVLPVGSIMAGFLTPFAVVGNAARQVSSTLSRPFIKGANGLNIFLGGFQNAFRLGTLDAQAETTLDVIEKNAPGSELSLFGAIESVATVANFQYSFLKYYKARQSSVQQREGLRKFAGVVNSSGDDWINDRGRDDLIANISFISAGFETAGGSELRFVKRGGKEFYNWSSLDTMQGFFEIVLPAPLPNLKLPLPLGGSSKQWQVGGNGLPPGPAGWKSNAGHYGDAWGVTPVSATMASTATLPLPPASYQGLAPYTGIDEKNYPGVYAGPAFVIGVKMKQEKISTSDNTSTTNAALTTGQLAVNTSTAGGGSLFEKDASVYSLAAGEAYYKRPGSNETANLFSPYWSARLTEVDNTTKQLAVQAQTFSWSKLVP